MIFLINNAQRIGTTGIETHRHLGEKRYEIKDHLGNVRAVTSDIKNASNYNLVASSWRFLADVRSLNSYHPYGSLIDAGSWSGSSYNFGYNGMLKEGIGKDISHTHFRNLSSGDYVGWWSPDPKENIFPNVSPYIVMGNNPILNIDRIGDNPTKFYFTEFSVGGGFAAPWADYYYQNGTAYDDIGVTFFTTTKANNVVSHTKDFYASNRKKVGDVVFGGDLSYSVGAQIVNKNTFYESIKTTENNAPLSVNAKGLWGVSISWSFEKDSWWLESFGISTGPGIGLKFSHIDSDLVHAVSISNKEASKLKGVGLINTTYTIEKIKILDNSTGKEKEVNRLYGFETRGGKLNKIDTGINLIKTVKKLKDNKIQEIYKSEDYIKQETK